MFGISVFDSFMSESTALSGIVPDPNLTERLLGGHALACVGFDDSKGCFIFRNSWGTNWGLNGYGYISYNYLTNPGLCADTWTIRKTGTESVKDYQVRG